MEFEYGTDQQSFLLMAVPLGYPLADGPDYIRSFIFIATLNTSFWTF